MFNHVMAILQNGGLWAFVLIILRFTPQVNHLIEAHLATKKATRRNAHELSLMRAADRIIPGVLKVAEATKKDRLNQAADELAQYANARGIHVTEPTIKHYIAKAIHKYKANGGNVAETVRDTITGA